MSRRIVQRVHTPLLSAQLEFMIVHHVQLVPLEQRRELNQRVIANGAHWVDTVQIQVPCSFMNVCIVTLEAFRPNRRPHLSVLVNHVLQAHTPSYLPAHVHHVHLERLIQVSIRVMQVHVSHVPMLRPHVPLVPYRKISASYVSLDTL